MKKYILKGICQDWEAELKVKISGQKQSVSIKLAPKAKPGGGMEKFSKDILKYSKWGTSRNMGVSVQSYRDLSSFTLFRLDALEYDSSL